MGSFLLLQLGFLLRLIVAGVCGFLIGYERENRLKEAGIRTHLIVALGSALIMIISKYGFADVLGANGVGLDPSRIAAQIVSGIGFLGAGTIFVRKQAISGLTTAAGVWATAGVGMAIGANLYFVGISATVLILIVQIILHKDYKWIHIPMTEQISIQLADTSESIAFVQKEFGENGIEIVNLKAGKPQDGVIDLEASVKLPEGFDALRLMNLLKDNPYVRSVQN